ncbi:MAG TPA: DUF29 domain-containing protein [Stellaceae bacterium]|nr:DUF29 domain-containing protein [Stellaceae bacterium]
MSNRLYEEDFVRWSEEQAAALRKAAGSGVNLPLDWDNLAEEIESLGASQRYELRSRIAVIVEHLLKLEYSPAKNPRRGWIETIGRERLNIEDLLEDSPSLRREVAAMVERSVPRVARLVGQILQRHKEGAPDLKARLAAASYTPEQVLGDWFPASTLSPQRGERAG